MDEICQADKVRFSDEQRKIYDLVRSGGAFTNPQSGNVSTTVSTIDDEILKIQNSTSLELYPTIPAVPPALDPGDEIIAKLEDLKTTLGSFTSHTNRLSGVSRANLGQLPDVHQLLGLSRARELLYINLLTDNAADLGQQLFGSLFDISDSDFNGYNTYITTIVDYIEVLPTPLRTVTEILDEIDTIQGVFNSAISRDTSAYNTTLSELRDYSLTNELSILDTECEFISQNVVTDKIGSQQLLNLRDIILQNELLDE